VSLEFCMKSGPLFFGLSNLFVLYFLQKKGSSCFDFQMQRSMLPSDFSYLSWWPLERGTFWWFILLFSIPFKPFIPQSRYTEGFKLSSLDHWRSNLEMCSHWLHREIETSTCLYCPTIKWYNQDMVLNAGRYNRYIGRYISDLDPYQHDSIKTIGHIGLSRYWPTYIDIGRYLYNFSMSFFLNKPDLDPTFKLYYAIIDNLRLSNVY